MSQVISSHQKVSCKSLVEKLSFMTILCHLDTSFQTFALTWTHHSEHSCYIGPFSCHIGHFLSFWTVLQKTMFSTSEYRSYQ